MPKKSTLKETTATEKPANNQQQQYYIERINIPDNALVDFANVYFPEGCKVISAAVETPAYEGEMLFLYAIAVVGAEKKKVERRVRALPSRTTFSGTELLTKFTFVASLKVKSKMHHIFVEMTE